MRKLRPPPRPFVDPPIESHSLEFHALQLKDCLASPRDGEAGRADLKAAAYAIAAFDPRTILESMHAQRAIMSSQHARACPNQRLAAQLEREAIANLRILEEMQSRPQRTPPSPQRNDASSDFGLGATLDARAWGYTPWLELIRDATLRRRLGA